MEKNKDAVAEDLIDLLKSSYTPWISKIFQDKVVPEAKKSGPQRGGSKTTAATYFKNQLTSLVTTLGETSPHYVRCIKPNMENEAFLFDDDQVLSQLRYSGMLDTIKIRKAGFDVRIPFDQFIRRYVLIGLYIVFNVCCPLIAKGKIHLEPYRLNSWNLYLFPRRCGSQERPRCFSSSQRLIKFKIWLISFLMLRSDLSKGI
jgi:hypothetical protein